MNGIHFELLILHISFINQHAISIFFVYPITPLQYRLGDRTNIVLIKTGLNNDIDFNSSTDHYIVQVVYSLDKS